MNPKLLAPLALAAATLLGVALAAARFLPAAVLTAL
jgi:hypothetical protein